VVVAGIFKPRPSALGCGALGFAPDCAKAEPEIIVANAAAKMIFFTESSYFMFREPINRTFIFSFRLLRQL
jgi:hypothetical protein